jgi:hypothetical protein
MKILHDHGVHVDHWTEELGYAVESYSLEKWQGKVRGFAGARRGQNYVCNRNIFGKTPAEMSKERGLL